jgi:hypothetical protein
VTAACCARRPVRLAAGIGRALLLAAGHRNPILVAIVVLGPHGIAYFSRAGAQGLPEVRSIWGMSSRMRALPQII